MTELDRAAAGLARRMERRGDWPASAPWIRRAVEALPRHRFAPDRLWEWDGHAWRAVDRRADPDRWTRLVYGDPDAAAVTEVADGLPSSSLSCQAVVVGMLAALRLEPGQRVLELGTGTGWNAALLAARAGTEAVASVEVSPGLAAAARIRLAAAGSAVTVETGDGRAGRPGGAPYDRIVSTYAVERVPWAWVEQCRPGGRIVTPWGRLGHVALTTAPDGESAEGRFVGLAQFMPDRTAAAPPGRTYADIRGTGPAEDERPFDRGLTPLRDDAGLRFALRVAVPDAQIRTAVDDDGVSAWLHDGTASWAALSAQGAGRTVAYQGGPRRLADELERAWDEWLALGRPGPREYGMTVSRTAQSVWCAAPSGARREQGGVRV